MNCAEFREVVHELARAETRPSDKILSAAATVSARFHTQTCESCAARLAEARSLASALEMTAENSAGLEAPAYLQTVLINSLREHHRSRERIQYRQRQSRLRRAEWMAVAVAVVVLFAIGAWKSLQRHSASAAHQGSGFAVRAGSSTPESAADALSDSDFVPVPYGETLSADDSGVVVRVSMTRSALASLGYPVDEGRARDVIQADLVVGEDGWPRAVRLVQ